MANHHAHVYVDATDLNHPVLSPGDNGTIYVDLAPMPHAVCVYGTPAQVIEWAQTIIEDAAPHLEAAADRFEQEHG